jgi:hypothetical protein
MRYFSHFNNPFVNTDERNHHLSSTSVRPQQRAIIVEADDDKLIDRRLLFNLSDMECTIKRDPEVLTIEERVLSIMCQE